ncbi:GGDEF domain-containing protein [Teredinibacter haidensis]|uniref:GGDEF domain-containing protein n=1 Tax=Teredinibacter haidensis TaxID=2731755 RepID=UPI000948E0DF|nr:GGDEF domain-containing protein [Teredinibacter haidensis]
MELEHIEVFPWSSNLEMGIPHLDEQHKTLVVLLNRLADTLVREDKLEIESVFEDLAAYAAYHFKDEEKVWSEYLDGDEWCESHLYSHQSFLPRVREIKEQGEHKPFREVIEDVVRFLIRWLAIHILDDDRKLALVVKGIQQGLDIEAAKQQAEEKMEDSINVFTDTVLGVCNSLSSRALELMRERLRRQEVENELKQANAELEKLTITDQLTGLHNRRHFDEVLRLELQRGRRNASSVSLIAVDIDFFKKLNDRYGHSSGDEALKKVADMVGKACRRSGDFCFRVGGEEFYIVSSSLAPEDALAFAENVRLSVEALKIPNERSDVSNYVTISIGVLTKIPTKEDTKDAYLISVDRNLYKAKGDGRNCVVSTIT